MRTPDVPSHLSDHPGNRNGPLEKFPGLDVGGLRYRTKGIHGSIMIPCPIPEDPPIAIVEKRPNTTFPLEFSPYPTSRFLKRIWQDQSLLVDNHPSGLTIARSYSHLLNALLILSSPEEARLLQSSGFKLNTPEYFEYILHMDKLLHS